MRTENGDPMNPAPNTLRETKADVAPYNPMGEAIGNAAIVVLFLLLAFAYVCAKAPAQDSRPDSRAASRPVAQDAADFERANGFGPVRALALRAVFPVFEIVDGVLTKARKAAETDGLYDGFDAAHWTERGRALVGDMDLFKGSMNDNEADDRFYASYMRSLTADEAVAAYSRFGVDIGGGFRASPIRYARVELRGRTVDLDAVAAACTFVFVGKDEDAPRAAEFLSKMTTLFGEPVPYRRSDDWGSERIEPLPMRETATTTARGNVLSYSRVLSCRTTFHAVSVPVYPERGIALTRFREGEEPGPLMTFEHVRSVPKPKRTP